MRRAAFSAFTVLRLGFGLMTRSIEEPAYLRKPFCLQWDTLSHFSWAVEEIS